MSQTWAYRIESWADLPGAIAANERAGAIGQAHLLRALAAGRIAYFSLLPDTSSSSFKAFARATSRKPAVTLLGDDDGMDRGPPGWRLATRAVRWAASIVLHGAGAELAHYETAIVASQIVGRVLIVECGTATLDAWAALVRAAPHQPSVLVIVPRGGVHPLPMDRGAMQ